MPKRLLWWLWLAVRRLLLGRPAAGSGWRGVATAPAGGGGLRYPAGDGSRWGGCSAGLAACRWGRPVSVAGWRCGPSLSELRWWWWGEECDYVVRLLAVAQLLWPCTTSVCCCCAQIN